MSRKCTDCGRTVEYAETKHTFKKTPADLHVISPELWDKWHGSGDYGLKRL